MHTFLASVFNRSLYLRIFFLACLVLVFSGWTCSAIFLSCQGVEPLQATSLSPDHISAGEEPILLTVGGTGFTPQSTIMWNGNALQTIYIDGHHLRTGISWRTLQSLGSSLTNDVQISVRSHTTMDDMGCPIGGTSGSLILLID